MAVVNLTKENFEETIENSDFVIVDFWAPWCGPCKSFGPVFERVSEQFENIVFAKINTEEEQELGASLQIRSIPTLMIFREKVLIFNQAGALPEPAFKDLVQKASDLDMAEVHKQIEAEQAKES